MELFYALILGYFLGSLPFGFILVKLFKKEDVREIGSHNIGATNVLRAGHIGLAILTVILDTLKGIIAVSLCRSIFHDASSFSVTTLASATAIASVIGHIFPIWLKFKGGKGVATSFGVILATHPETGLLSFFIWVIIAVLYRYSSLAAIVSFGILPILCIILRNHLFFYFTAISILVLFKHKENIVRLIKNQEPKINFTKNNDQ